MGEESKALVCHYLHRNWKYPWRGAYLTSHIIWTLQISSLNYLLRKHGVPHLFFGFITNKYNRSRQQNLYKKFTYPLNRCNLVKITLKYLNVSTSKLNFKFNVSGSIIRWLKPKTVSMARFGELSFAFLYYCLNLLVPEIAVKMESQRLTCHLVPSPFSALWQSHTEVICRIRLRSIAEESLLFLKSRLAPTLRPLGSFHCVGDAWHVPFLRFSLRSQGLEQTLKTAGWVPAPQCQGHSSVPFPSPPVDIIHSTPCPLATKLSCGRMHPDLQKLTPPGFKLASSQDIIPLLHGYGDPEFRVRN